MFKNALRIYSRVLDKSLKELNLEMIRPNSAEIRLGPYQVVYAHIHKLSCFSPSLTIESSDNVLAELSYGKSEGFASLTLTDQLDLHVVKSENVFKVNKNSLVAATSQAKLHEAEGMLETVENGKALIAADELIFLEENERFIVRKGALVGCDVSVESKAVKFAGREFIRLKGPGLCAVIWKTGEIPKLTDSENIDSISDDEEEKSLLTKILSSNDIII